MYIFEDLKTRVQFPPRPPFLVYSNLEWKKWHFVLEELYLEQLEISVMKVVYILFLHLELLYPFQSFILPLSPLLSGGQKACRGLRRPPSFSTRHVFPFPLFFFLAPPRSRFLYPSANSAPTSVVVVLFWYLEFCHTAKTGVLFCFVA